MTGEKARFTSDRRVPSNSSWTDDGDWAAGVAEGVDVVDGGLIGRPSMQHSELPGNASLQYHYDATALETLLSGGGRVSNGGAIDEWQTLEGSENLTGAAPTRNDGGIGSQTTVSFNDEGDTLVGSAASNWAFLNDGSPFTIYLVARTHGSGGRRFALTTQGTNNSTIRGASLFRDDRSSEGRSNEFRFRVSNGSDWVASLIASNEWPGDSDELFSVVYDPTSGTEYAAYRGKTQIATDTEGRFSTGDPNIPGTMGDTTETTAPFNGEQAELPIYSVAHGDATREEVTDYLANKWGISV